MTRHLIVAVAMLTACAGAPRGARTPTPLTSVDTVYYEVAGSTPAQWRRELPRAAQAAGIPGSGVTYTLAHMLLNRGYLRTTSTGCQFEQSFLQLRIGHVMPRLPASVAPSAEDRASWDAFVAALWERAHVREEVGQRLADSIRAEVRGAHAQECAPLIEQTRRKTEAFGARYRAAVQAADASLGEELRPVLP
jgi:predicted secreted Zn-dependent protease